MNKMKKQILSLVMALIMTLASLPTALAADAAPTPAASDNIYDQQYINGETCADTVKSYLYENPTGGLTRVEYIVQNKQLIVEDYNDQFQLQSSRILPMELPLWGGFFAGETYNFVVFGQNVEDENDEKEAVRVVKYSKDWQRLGACSLKGVNTCGPFLFGSLRCAEYDGYLYIHTCHQMYRSGDGLNHQANMTFNIRESDMERTDSLYRVANFENWGYVSHSFNQFILVDSKGRVVTLDHGDGEPRGIGLYRYNAKAGQDSLYERGGTAPWEAGYGKYGEPVVVRTFSGNIGDNHTGAAIGGFVETASGYVTAYTLNSNPYMAFVDKESLEVSERRFGETAACFNPQLVATGPDGGYALWQRISGLSSGRPSSVGHKVYYARYNSAGEFVGGKDGIQASVCDAELSDCQPIVWNGKAVWYVTDNSAPTFYTLDDSGVTTHVATSAGTSNIAYATTLTVRLDGEPVTFQTYALKDANGNLTNYIRLRDLAYYLNGTRATIDVSWSVSKGVTISIPVYYNPDGSEFSTPFSGDRPYQLASGRTRIDNYRLTRFGDTDLEAITLQDDNGGGYTYYKLRDLGRELDFNVSWIAGQGVVIDTTTGYDPTN